MTTSPRIHPVILSGGSGTRLWPMSRESYPKQFLPMISDRSMLQETVARVSDGGLFAAPTLVCSEEHRFLVAEQARCAGSAPHAIILEPAGRNTAPAVAVSCLILAADDADALVLILPSDATVARRDAFLEAVRLAAAAADTGALVTFGVAPTAPETGYGYIRRGKALGKGAFRVAEFVEKPDPETAAGYLADGGYFWNSGMFLFRAAAYLDELGRLRPDMLARCREAVDGAARDLDFIRLAEAPFTAIAGESIDYAVMEHTDAAAVVPAELGWSDVGSWSALWELGARDKDGNVIAGDVVTVDARNSYLRSEAGLLAALGVEDMIVVATADAVMVLPRDRAQEVKTLVDRLKAEGRTEPQLHPRVYRPWGYYQTVHEGERFQVKRITVNVGASLSLQMHRHRAEHWVVVHGAAEVTRDHDTFILNETESTYIPAGVKHRLANPGKLPVHLIEVQTGGYLGEDDIVRFDDVYGRS